jgi:hypothetical protein
MPIGRVTVLPPQKITVRQSNQQQSRVQTITYGNYNTLGLIQHIYDEANLAISVAQTANNTANIALSTANNKVDKAGDTMTGTLIVNRPAEVIATIDGGEFS